MWQKTLIGAALLAMLSAVISAQEPRPKLPPPDGGPREEGFGPDGPRGRGGKGERGPGPGGPGERIPGERGKGSPPFGGRGPMGGGPMGGGGPGFRPGMLPGGDDADRSRQEDPEMHRLTEQDYQLAQQTLEVAGELRRATGDQQAKLKQQLTELVNKHFDVRQQRRELQLKQMEAELGRLREAIKERNDIRDAIIKQRMSELAGPAKDLGF